MTQVNTFYISDTHFGHNGICKFLRADGTKVRPWDDIHEMNEALIKNWNDTVKPGDKVYHLGDVVINRKFLPIMERLNGRKCLVRGNHDHFHLEEYAKYFYEIQGVRVKGDFILSHIPLHPDSVGRFKANVHGHTHTNSVMDPRWPTKFDSRYFCVSVEQINYTPMEHTVLVAAIKKRMQDNPPPAEEVHGDPSGKVAM